jgi:nucleotide-binding universal stress UspA family protein
MKTKIRPQKVKKPAPLRRIGQEELAADTGEIIDVVPALLHLKRILVPIDFSSYSAKALSYALRFAEQFDAAVVALHVIQPMPILPTDMITVLPPQDMTGEQLPVISAKLRKLCQRASSNHHLTVTPLVVVGTPYERIVEIAESEDADLLIIATHGYTGLKHFYMGSTTERVVRHAPCPVLVVRDKERDFVELRRRRAP